MNTYFTLLSIGVPIKVHGHRYLMKALDILMNDEEAAFSITKHVYMQVAKEYGISTKQAEGAMRIAIEQAWNRGSCERHEMIFGYSRLEGKRPCISEFLLRLCEYIKLTA